MAPRNSTGKSLFSPPSKSHAIVTVLADIPWHLDQTRSNASLKEGSIFAHLRFINSVLRICPTINLPNDVEDVFLGHDGPPNLVFNRSTNTLTVDVGGIEKGDILMCRCTQNTVVQVRNNLFSIVDTKQGCTAFDQTNFYSKGAEVAYHGKADEDVEHSEEGGGVLIGEGLAGWGSIREGMERERFANADEVKIKIEK